jgi:tRNA-dihydrouridine synthase C
VQLLGGDPTRLADSAQVAVRLGASAIDINFGCPAPTVNRHDGGATLLKYPERIKAIVAAVRSAVPNHLPVSAKLRLGWDDPSAIITNAEMAAEGGASWITIHGRTRMQGYTPPAYWRPIGDVRKALSIPVVANGEIWSLDDLKRCIDQSGCMHFMLGRGVLAQPRLVLDCARYLGLPHEGYSDIHLYSWPNLLQRLVDRAVEHGESERRILSRVKQWLNYAHKHGSYQNFQQMKRVSSTTELYAALGVDERRKECAV